MQGWRDTQEDAHIADLDIGNGISIFGVFDGHGGPEVAKFVQQNFIHSLKSCSAFKRQEYKLALEKTFLRMDRLMQTEKGQEELKKYMLPKKREDREEEV